MEEVVARSTSAELLKLRSTYTAQRFLFIPGEQVARLAVAMGADLSDIVALSAAANGLPADPTLPFRRSRNGRFGYEFRERRVRRLEHQPFVLSTAEDFIRHDSGKIREFQELEADMQTNSVFNALLKLNYLLIEGVATAERPGLDYSCSLSVCTVFHLRTVTTPELRGEPALEGVHSDGVDHTMTTFVGCSNMQDGSAETLLHANSELSGRRWDKSDATRLLGRFKHRKLLDTLLIVDHEQKHSVSPVAAVSENATATRDMLVFFARKPARYEHVSYPYDSFTDHPHRGESLQVPQL